MNPRGTQHADETETICETEDAYAHAQYDTPYMFIINISLMIKTVLLLIINKAHEPGYKLTQVLEYTSLLFQIPLTMPHLPVWLYLRTPVTDTLAVSDV